MSACMFAISSANSQKIFGTCMKLPRFGTKKNPEFSNRKRFITKHFPVCAVRCHWRNLLEYWPVNCLQLKKIWITLIKDHLKKKWKYSWMFTNTFPRVRLISFSTHISIPIWKHVSVNNGYYILEDFKKLFRLCHFLLSFYMNITNYILIYIYSHMKK